MRYPTIWRAEPKPVEKNKDNEYVIEFRNVSFKYPASGEYALKDVNIKFRAGEKLAVVGRNGSGKTTFIKLLCRLYDPTEGTILLNGKDIRDYDYSEYLGIFSVVFQDFKLFAFKLGDNVAGRSDYNASLADECLEKAGFADRLKTLEKGEETYLYKEFERDGVDLSGGEAQKVALARALYKNAPFIILDEPTAALEPRCGVGNIFKLQFHCGRQDRRIYQSPPFVLPLLRRYCGVRRRQACSARRP